MENERVQELLGQLQKQCLGKGVGGIKGLAVVFRRMDVDFSKHLCFSEFEKGVRDYGLDVGKDDLTSLFKAFDRNKNNQIEFLELLAKLQPDMSKKRKEVVNEAFNVLDANKDGVLEMEDLKGKVTNSSFFLFRCKSDIMLHLYGTMIQI